MSHIINPYSGRMIAANGVVHRRLISLGLMDEFGHTKNQTAEKKSKPPPLGPQNRSKLNIPKKFKIAPPPRVSSPDSIEEADSCESKEIDDAYDDE